MPHIISLAGFIGSGKDTVADYLVQNFGFVRDSFASPLKDAVSAVFGWDRALLEGLTPESRHWREQVDPWWSNRLDCPHLTPRWVLQYWGTEVCRKNFHEDIWIASLENRLRSSTKNIVISDGRFFNELDSVKRLGGTSVRIIRSAEPAWYELAVQANQGCERSQKKLYELKVHASETSWVGYNFDRVLANTGTIDQLYVKINDLVQDLQIAR